MGRFGNPSILGMKMLHRMQSQFEGVSCDVHPSGSIEDNAIEAEGNTSKKPKIPRLTLRVRVSKCKPRF